MNNPLYTMMINNCANLLKRKAELSLALLNGYGSTKALQEYQEIEDVTAFDLAYGIAIGCCKRQEDVILDIINAQQGEAL